MSLKKLILERLNEIKWGESKLSTQFDPTKSDHRSVLTHAMQGVKGLGDKLKNNKYYVVGFQMGDDALDTIKSMKKYGFKSAYLTLDGLRFNPKSVPYAMTDNYELVGGLPDDNTMKVSKIDSPSRYATYLAWSIPNQMIMLIEEDFY